MQYDYKVKIYPEEDLLNDPTEFFTNSNYKHIIQIEDAEYTKYSLFQ